MCSSKTCCTKQRFKIVNLELKIIISDQWKIKSRRWKINQFPILRHFNFSNSSLWNFSSKHWLQSYFLPHPPPPKKSPCESTVKNPKCSAHTYIHGLCTIPYICIFWIFCLVWFGISRLHDSAICSSGFLSFNTVISTNGLLSWKISFTFRIFQQIRNPNGNITHSSCLKELSDNLRYILYKYSKYNNFTVFSLESAYDVEMKFNYIHRPLTIQLS